MKTENNLDKIETAISYFCHHAKEYKIMEVCKYASENCDNTLCPNEWDNPIYYYEILKTRLDKGSCIIPHFAYFCIRDSVRRNLSIKDRILEMIE